MIGWDLSLPWPLPLGHGSPCPGRPGWWHRYPKPMLSCSEPPCPPMVKREYSFTNDLSFQCPSLELLFQPPYQAFGDLETRARLYQGPSDLWVNSPLEENFLHLSPLSFGIFEYEKYIWVETYGLDVFSKCWGQDLATSINLPNFCLHRPFRETPLNLEVSFIRVFALMCKQNMLV